MHKDIFQNSMTHEFKHIVTSYLEAAKEYRKCVLATLVDLDGSSYRRPGVRMLITEDGKMTGAISGGCIEKEVVHEAVSVFRTGIPKMMTYDGRYRLGCEGTIYILIEIFNPSSQFISAFNHCLEDRQSFFPLCYYSREMIEDRGMGTIVTFSGQEFLVNQEGSMESLKSGGMLTLSQVLPPMFKLIIFGGEYDAARLSTQASFLGWQVIVVTNPLDGYTIANFPGSSLVIQAAANQLPDDFIDQDTAVVMMSHNYAKDLSYLLAIKDYQPAYLGLLGPANRRNNLLNDMLERAGEIPGTLMRFIFGPAGLNIGSETAEEIALSICSEIISLKREKDAGNLKNLNDEIHSSASH